MEAVIFVPLVLGPALVSVRLFWLLLEAKQQKSDLAAALEVAADSLRYYRGADQDKTCWLEGKLFQRTDDDAIVEPPEFPGMEAGNTLAFIGGYIKPEPPCAHQWKTQAAGGNPADVESYERVTFCVKCGEEPQEV
jgi:hypothetical protein